MIATLLIVLVAALHAYFMVLEMFFWHKPVGKRAFGTSDEFATASKTLAANQGLYNGFLAVGLLLGLVMGPGGTTVKIFFLVCIIIAGIFGALTSNQKILFIQAAPAALALVALLLT